MVHGVTWFCTLPAPQLLRQGESFGDMEENCPGKQLCKVSHPWGSFCLGFLWCRGRLEGDLPR